MSIKHRTSPLVFTREGHFDPTWLLVAVVTVAGCVGFYAEITERFHASVSAWTFLATALLALLIAAVPINKARILAGAKNLDAVSRTFASVQPNAFHDDERGAHTEREPVAHEG